MNTINFQQGTGFPLEAETLGFMQNTYVKALSALAKMAGENNVILTGMIDSGTSVSDGWVLFQDEVFFFKGGIKTATFIVNEVVTPLNNANGNAVDRYYERQLRFGTGGVAYAYSLLRRVQSLQGLESKLSSCFFEGNVILAGCNVVSFDPAVPFIEISAGIVKVQDSFYYMPTYTGAYPIYIDSNGVWTQNSTSPDDIFFNPQTSQYLADVYKRATTPIGEIVMRASLSSNFDSIGLGLFSLAGWALCNGANGTVDLRGRTVMGYDERVNDPSNGIWDSAYNTVSGIGGEKAHQLSIDEMPSHNHTAQSTGTGFNDINSGGFGLLRKSATNESNTVRNPDAVGSGDEPDLNSKPKDIPFQGENTPHENRPPFMVVAFLQRI